MSSPSLPVLACLWITMSAAAAAQMGQRSALVGRVTDGTAAPVANAVVKLGGESVLGGTRATETDAEGRYRFAGLLPGTYTLTAVVPGFRQAVRGPITLPVETTYTVDLRLELSPLLDRVDVPADAPLVDVTTAAAPTLFRRDLLQSIPTGRTMEAVLNLAPGVTRGVGFGGTEGTSNGFAVDRVSLADPYEGGPWVPVAYNWLEAVQVVALGAPAEYSQFTGALANGVLRSGSDRYSVLAEFLAAVPQWTGDNTGRLADDLRESFAPRRIQRSLDANVQIGGPVRRERAWFFGGLGASSERYRPFGYTGTDLTQRREPSGLVKFDVSAAPTVVALQGFYQRDRSTLEGDGLSFNAPTLVSTGDVKRHNDVWQARMDWTLGRSTVLEVRTGGFAGWRKRLPHPPATEDGPPVTLELPAFVVSGNVLNTVDNQRQAVSTGVRLATNRIVLGQQHELVVGIEHERTWASTHVGYGGGRVDAFFDGTYWESHVFAGNRNSPSHRRTALYVQDRWALRGTPDPGARDSCGHLPGSRPGRWNGLSRPRPWPRASDSRGTCSPITAPSCAHITAGITTSRSATSTHGMT